MQQEILDYLNSQRIGVLAVEMPDGSPHSATVHFGHMENPFVFFFETSRESRKAQPLLGRDITRASFVIGSDESAMKTFQLDGVVRLITDKEMEIFNTIYLGKFPAKKEKADASKFISFTFIPKWWRYTDFKSPQGKLILTSEQK